MSDIKTTLRITSEHDCYWLDAFEHTADELEAAYQKIDELQAALDAEIDAHIDDE